ncbi:MAG TPA: TfoX/Sxy family protein [Xanthomonadaceae bacterium]|jgi:DNA transformation protein|nr:TfoX/Sxy family protein [Xanthomonadaceae bacterium]
MRTDEAFIAHLHELLDPLGRVAARAMFGGWGLYLDGTIIGLVDEGRLYLKTDATSQPEFAAAGCAAFVYMSEEGPMTMSYWSAPDDALDSTEAMAPWARRARDAALRKKAGKPPGTAKSRKPSVAAGPAKPRKTNAGGKVAKSVSARKTIATSMTAKTDRNAKRREPR